MNKIKEIPIEETRKRLEQRQKEEENKIEKSNIGERISKDGKKRLSIDNYTGDFFIEEHKTKTEAKKRLNRF